MPAWAVERARRYWLAADAYERANARLYAWLQVGLPVELDRGQRRELAKSFAGRVCDAERLPYTLAVHAGAAQEPGRTDNPHFHLLVSERANDGIARSLGQWFRRWNGKAPERGGARKSVALRPMGWCQHVRQEWAAECNRALEAAGRPERIDPRPLAEQARAALDNGDLERAADLARIPQPRRGEGDHIQRRRTAAERRGVPGAELPPASRLVAEWHEVERANARLEAEWLDELEQGRQNAPR